MLPPRFRLRTLLLSVAIVAFVLAGGLTLHKRRQRFLRLASQHGVAHSLAEAASGMATATPTVEGLGAALMRLPDEMAGGAKAQATYYAALRVKYERAARFPWLAVEPDPPEPKRATRPF